MQLLMAQPLHKPCCLTPKVCLEVILKDGAWRSRTKFRTLDPDTAVIYLSSCKQHDVPHVSIGSRLNSALDPQKPKDGLFLGV